MTAPDACIYQYVGLTCDCDAVPLSTSAKHTKPAGKRMSFYFLFFLGGGEARLETL